MAKLLKLRRGTDTQHSSFTGAEGEVTVNTTNDSLHVHDGTTAGGHELMRADKDNMPTSGVTAGTYGSSTAIPSLTVDSNGLVTSATTSAIDSTSIANGTSNVSVANNGNITAARSGTTRLTVNGGGIDVNGSVTCDGLTSSNTGTFEATAEYQLVVKDSNNTGQAAETGVAFADSGNTVQAFLGHVTASTNDFYVKNILDGDIVFGTGNADRCRINSDGHFVPQTDNTVDIGAPGLEWRNAHFDGTVNCDAFSCPTAVTAGSYGSASAIPNFTVDSSGRLTAAGTSALNNASETVSGIVELATAAETTTGTSTTRAVHPAGLKVELDKKLDSDISSLPTLP